MDTIRIPLVGGGESFLPVSEENYLSLRKDYRQAVKQNVGEFTWRQMKLLTTFAQYMLEYMEMSPLIDDAVKAEPDPDEDE